jgi:hypothetical protein
MKVMNRAEHIREEHKYGPPPPPKKKTSVIMTRAKDWRRGRKHNNETRAL